MKQQENGQIPLNGAELPDLDAELAEMAEEVPPMPADFHARWTQAVREDAEKRREPETVQKAGKAVTFTKGPWFRALSVAAVFVFLIGGTMLYRSGKNRIAPVYQAENRKEPVETSLPEPEMIPEDAAEAGLTAEEEPKGLAAGVPAAGMDMAAEATGMKAGSGAMPEAEEADAAFETAEGTAFEAEEGAAAFDAVAATGAATEDTPAMNGAAGSRPAEEHTAEPTAEPVPAFPEQAGAFMADMGAFLLSVWPWLTVAAVLVLAWMFAVKRKKRS